MIGRPSSRHQKGGGGEQDAQMKTNKLKRSWLRHLYASTFMVHLLANHVIIVELQHFFPYIHADQCCLGSYGMEQEDHGLDIDNSKEME